jgi:hypothetical protein
MARVFHPRLNTFAKASVFGALFVIVGMIWIAYELQKSSWVTNVDHARTQPVPFSHEHHVSGLGIDCRYCHTSVESSNFAGIPATRTCMSCHSQIWTNAQLLEPVRESWRTGTPIAWNRVHNLPDFVYFHHDIHVQKGIGCSTCHGRVDRMPLVFQTASLQMAWCLDCHRQPEQFLRPRERIFEMDYQPPPDQMKLGRALSTQYHLLPPQLMENCSLCHR